jgi:hypothetical protein
MQIIAEVPLRQCDSIGSTVSGSSADVLSGGVVGGDGRARGAVTRIARIVVVSGAFMRASANDNACSDGLYFGSCGCDGQSGT